MNRVAEVAPHYRTITLLICTDFYVRFLITRSQSMCLAIPMKISRIDGLNARCASKGVERDVSLILLQDETPKEGDYVLIHVGYAIQKISEEEAVSTWELLDQMLAMEAADA
jgi:hydrogenase expression/formation protein HypC